MRRMGLLGAVAALAAVATACTGSSGSDIRRRPHRWGSGDLDLRGDRRRSGGRVDCGSECHTAADLRAAIGSGGGVLGGRRKTIRFTGLRNPSETNAASGPRHPQRARARSCSSRSARVTCGIAGRLLVGPAGRSWSWSR